MQLARDAIERKEDTVVVMMTGRRFNVFGERIKRICRSLHPPLDFDL